MGHRKLPARVIMPRPEARSKILKNFLARLDDVAHTKKLDSDLVPGRNAHRPEE